MYRPFTSSGSSNSSGSGGSSSSSSDDGAIMAYRQHFHIRQVLSFDPVMIVSPGSSSSSSGSSS